MPVPSSGELKLRADIANEVDGSATGDNVSLGTLSNSAGFTEPDEMSEFYGYSSCTSGNVIQSNPSASGFTSITVNATITNGGCGPRGVNDACTNTSCQLDFGFRVYSTGWSLLNETWAYSNQTVSYGHSYSWTWTGASASTTYYVYPIVRKSGTTDVVMTNMKSVTTNTPAQYSLQNTYSNTMRWNSPQQMSWSHLQISADAMWSSSARGEYHHDSYGWTTYNSYGNTGWGTRPSSGYQPYINDSRYKRTDTTQLTEHRMRMNGTLSNGSIPAYNSFQALQGGSSSTPSGCTSGATIYNKSYSNSGCNWGCGTSSTMNCNCGNTNPQWYNGIWHEAAHAGTSAYQNVQSILEIPDGC